MQVIVSTPQELKTLIQEVLETLLVRANIQKANESQTKKYLSFEESATYLGIAHSTLYAYNSNRVIPYANRGRKAYYKQTDLDAFIESNRKQTAAEFAAQSMSNLRNKKK